MPRHVGREQVIEATVLAYDDDDVLDRGCGVARVTVSASCQSDGAERRRSDRDREANPGAFFHVCNHGVAPPPSHGPGRVRGRCSDGPGPPLVYIGSVRDAQGISGRNIGYRGLVLALALLGTLPALAQAPGGAGTHPAEHQHLDSRFAHNRYYYDRGYAVHSPPDGGIANLHGADGQRYYFYEGNWYRWRGTWDQSWRWDRWWHGGWVVSAPPADLFVPLA